MPTTTPEACFRFAAEQIALLREVYYRDDGVPESELRQLIVRLRKPEQPSSGRVFEKLRKMDMLEEMPGQTAFFELTAPWKEMLGHLFREQRLTAVAVIQTYLNELQRLDVDLSGEINKSNDSRCVILLEEIRSLVERLRRDSRDNRMSIITEALKFKSGGGDVASQKRYERIIHFWEKYVEPFRDIIDSRKEMHDRLRSLKSLMKAGAEQFRLDGIMAREFRSMRSRLVRLLRDAMNDHRESVRELEPLYNEALSNSRYLRGATLALNRLSRKGARSLHLKGRLLFPSVRSGGTFDLFSHDHMEAYLFHLSDYVPDKPKPVGTSAIERLPVIVPYADVHIQLGHELPVDDVFGWLRSTYSELSLHQTLGLYGRIFGDSTYSRVFGEAKEYRFDSVTICAYVLKLEVFHE